MSSTDASDLVDSDDSRAPMTSKSKQSVATRKPSSGKGRAELLAFRSQHATSAVRRKKRSRITLDGSNYDVALESRASKGKGKARAKSDSSSRSAASTAASKATARTRRGVRAKHKSAESSSSWQSSSGSSSSSSSDIDQNNRRTRTRGTLGGLPMKRVRGGSTFCGDVPAAGGSTGRGTNRRKHRCSSERDEAQTLKMKTSSPSGGLKKRLRPIRSGTGTRIPATRARKACPGRLRSKNTVVRGAPTTNSPKHPFSDTPYVCSQGSDDELGEREDEEGLKSHHDSRRSVSLRRESAAVGGRNRGKRDGPRTTKLRVVEEDGKQQNITVNTSDTRAALSEGDDDANVLRDTDSEVNRGDDSDKDDDNDDESVRCRCGAVNWKDGTRWIRCNGRGCGAWEHFGCAYREGAAAAGMNEAGSEEPPENRLCLACEGGRTSTFRARGRGRLLKSGDGFSPSKTLSEPTRASANAEAHGDGRSLVRATVRRSLRVVELREESRPPPRRKNVVGDEAYVESSSSSDIEVVGGREIGVGEDSDDAYVSDGFVVPEGKVETMQKFWCRCGGSREQDKIGGSAAKSAAGENQAAERWVQCRSDPCRVLEHAACCEHGCSERVRRHWCRECDPAGKKHAKSAERQKRKRRKRLRSDGSEGPGGPGSPSAASDARDQPQVKNGQGLYERSRVLLGRLWRAVAAGDATSVEQTFREAEGEKGRGLNTVRRLLEAEAPSEMLVGGSFDGETGDDGGGITQAQPVGITLLMFAAGYWAVHTATTAACDSSTENVGYNDAVNDSRAMDHAAATAAAAAAAVDAEQPVDLRAEIDQKGEGEGAAALRIVTVDEKARHSMPEAGGGSGGYGAGAEPRRRKDAPDLGSEARLAVLKAVLDRSYDGAVQDVDGSGRTAVHHASAVNAASEAALLLEGKRGAAAALATDHEGMTALHVAAAAGQAQACASILGSLEPGARARAILATERASGESALHVACAEGRAGCVEAIFREEKSLERELNRTGVKSHEPLVLARSAHGTTPLMAAAGCPSVACVKLVLDNLLGRSFGTLGEKVEELRAVDDGGMNALHWAAGRDAKGSVEAAKAVLEAERPLARLLFPHEYSDRATPAASGIGSGVGFGWDPLAIINARETENGASPLHLAAAVSHKEMVSLLLQQGANSVMLDEQGWTPVMYADFNGRKEGAVLELLHHEPEKQLEALGHVLSSCDDRQHPRVVEVMRNLATVPAFFSLVNGFVRKNLHLLVTTLSFLRDEPGLLDFENKMNLMRTLLTSPDLDLATRVALDHVARPPLEGFDYSYSERIQLRRGPGEALAALLLWMEDVASRWGDSGLAAWLRIRQPSFVFSGEAGYGPGVDREAWEMISEDLVLPRLLPPPSPSYAVQPASECAASGDGSGAIPRGNTVNVTQEAFFVPVDRGMTSYHPRDLHRAAAPVGSAGDGGGDGGSDCGGSGTRGWGEEEEEDLRAFELLGVIIGANLMWNKVLNLNLNPVVWKTVLSRKMRLADLELVDGMYFRSLKQVLDMDGADQLALTFDCLELKFCADGGGVDPGDNVTDENKERYAALALESRTFGRWRAQSHALSKGLRRLVPLRLLKMFTESELGLLLAGPGEIDPHDWQRHTVFSGEASTLFQAWFWSVVRSLTKEERSLLLQFATGCSRLPAGGFSGLPRPFTVAMLDYDPKRPLPMATTCFYMLKLPRYPEEYLLRKFLLVGIRHGSAGFEFS